MYKFLAFNLKKSTPQVFFKDFDERFLEHPRRLL